MTTDYGLRTTDSPRWLHRWAILSVCATLVLLTLGALVTTRRVGMADPIWPTYPWHLLLIDWEEPRPGFLLEHSHRLAGYVVGCCVIVLAAGLWVAQPRRWLAVLGFVALLAVIAQGLLGGFRVVLDQWLGQHLSLIHGFFAQIVFALLASLAVFTSSGWRFDLDRRGPRSRIRHWALLTAGLILVQILLGGFVRHTYWTLGQRGHLLVAFLVVGAVVGLVRLAFEHREIARSVRFAAHLLAMLVALQVAIGVEAWMSRLVPMSLTGQIVIRTAHFVVGASVFATAVVVMLQSMRAVSQPRRIHPEVRERELEVVA
jgi:cytochrome c oxidase assembly protein subunit 15